MPQTSGQSRGQTERISSFAMPGLLLPSGSIWTGWSGVQVAEPRQGLGRPEGTLRRAGEHSVPEHEDPVAQVREVFVLPAGDHDRGPLARPVQQDLEDDLARADVD